MRMGRWMAAPIALAMTIAHLACTNANTPLNRVEVPLKLRATNHTRATTVPSIPDPSAQNAPRDDNCFVGLALSGGGSRSANFSAACMFQLERIDLLDRVDYIS